MQDNLHYPHTDASLARADEEKWRLRKKATDISFTCNFQQILMSSILDEFCSLFFLQFHLENIILFTLFKYNFATSLMWPEITTFQHSLRKHLIKYRLVKQIKAALGWFQEQEPYQTDKSVSLLCQMLSPIRRVFYFLKLAFPCWQPPVGRYKVLTPKAYIFLFSILQVLCRLYHWPLLLTWQEIIWKPFKN